MGDAPVPHRVRPHPLYIPEGVLASRTWRAVRYHPSDKEEAPMPVTCSVCGSSTRDDVRAVHAACRGARPGGGRVVIPPRAEPDRRVTPPSPRLLTSPHEVEVEELPRGPKAVAKKIAERWEARWEHAETELLKEPTRGGESYGVRFQDDEGRHGWAVWIRGKFAGAFLYPHPTAILPTKLSASALKEVLSDG